MKSPIRWAGSKRQMLGALLPLSGDCSRYVEPFAGSACLFFALEPKEAILGDLNGELIRALRQLRDNTENVIKGMKLLKLDSASYYRLRKLDDVNLNGAEAAARFFILNRLCFNGLYRTNQAGKFNVPYGRHKNIVIDYSLFEEAAALLRNATLVHGDFEETLLKVREGDFVFLDPPYITRSVRAFSEYLPNSFSNLDLGRLKKLLENLHEKGVKFAVTYMDCSEARELLERWNPAPWTVKRNIAGFSAHRRTCDELLATNLSY
jgi:DNA adenine methylase